MSAYRIEYTIQRAIDEGEQEFEEIGFGSSATWSDINSALYSLSSDIQNRMWETEAGMPDPHEVDAPAEEGAA